MLTLRFLSILLLSIFCSSSFAMAEANKMHTAWLAEYEAFPAWYAKEKKLDMANGLELSFEIFATGQNLIDNMIVKNAVIGACGTAPALDGLVKSQFYVIGIGCDESAANAIYVRPDSPLIGINKESASKIKGKNVLLPLGTSSHLLYVKWLETLGVNQNEVYILDTVSSEALQAFLGGMGEAVAIWAPTSYAAEENNLVQLVNGRDLNLSMLTLVMADQKFADENPEQVKAFMRAYLQAIEEIKALPLEEHIALYQEFYHDFSNDQISENHALKEIQNHSLYSKDMQYNYLNYSENSNNLPKWLEDAIDYHANVNALGQSQINLLSNFKYITPKYLD